MRLVFTGLESPVWIERGFPSVLQVENQALFTRICTSLKSGEGRFALEPYTLWEDETEIKPSAALMFIADPFDLPWGDRSLIGVVTKRFENVLLQDDGLRGDIERLNSRLASSFLSLGIDLHGDYSFGIEWDIQRYMKAFGFGPDYSDAEGFLDTLIEFLSIGLDAHCEKVFVFVNLKTFLTKKELQTLYEHAIFTKSLLLLLENKQDRIAYSHERKTIIDLQFLE